MGIRQDDHPTTAIIYNHGYDWLQQSGSKTQSGLENVFITGKWQAFTNAQHEFVASLGVIREFGGSQATQNIGGDAYGATSPTAYFGKGLGDLPIGVLRPLAITGEFSYNIPDRRLNSALDNSGNPGLGQRRALDPVQHSLSAVAGEGFRPARLLRAADPAGRDDLVFADPGPRRRVSQQWTVSPGVIYLGDTFQVGVEALIPMNRQTGHNVGVIVQVHFFFDDLFPNTLGKPSLGVVPMKRVILAAALCSAASRQLPGPSLMRCSGTPCHQLVAVSPRRPAK